MLNHSLQRNWTTCPQVNQWFEPTGGGRSWSWGTLGDVVRVTWPGLGPWQPLPVLSARLHGCSPSSSAGCSQTGPRGCNHRRRSQGPRPGTPTLLIKHKIVIDHDQGLQNNYFCWKHFCCLDGCMDTPYWWYSYGIYLMRRANTGWTKQYLLLLIAIYVLVSQNDCYVKQMLTLLSRKA